MASGAVKQTFIRQTLKNIFSGWIAVFLAAITGLLATPIIIGKFGTEEYGIWFLILNFVAYFYIADLGITNAITRLFPKYKEDNALRVSDLVFTAYIIVLCVDVVLLFLLFYSADFLFEFLEIRTDLYQLFRLIFYIGVFEFLTQFVLRINFAILKGMHRIDLAYWFEATVSVFRILTVIFLLVFDSITIVQFALIYTLIKFSCDALSFLFVSRQLKESKIRFSTNCLKSLVDIGSSSLLSSSAVLLLNAVPAFVFGKLFSVDRVFLYSIPLAASFIFSRLSNAIYHGITPKAAELEVNGEIDKIYLINSFGSKSALIVGFNASLFVLIFGEDLMQLWLGSSGLVSSDIETIYLMLCFLMLYFFFSTFLKPLVFVYRSVGLHWVTTFENCSCVLIYALAAILLFPRVGEFVFAVAFCFVGVYRYLFYKIAAHSKIRTYTIPLLTVIGSFFLLFVAWLSLISVNGFLFKVAVFSFISFLHVFLVFKFLLSKNERALFIGQIRAFARI